MEIQLPKWSPPLFEPFRYKVLYGGRGSAKSVTIARVLLITGAQSRRKILCTREFQNSIADSVLSLLKEQAEQIGLSDFYHFGRDSIIGANGTEFLFKGLHHNINSIKSIPSITDCWIEEAQTISKLSWETLIPTIRENGSEIYISYNPYNEDDPVHERFVSGKEGPPPNSFILKVNWDDNEWFPEVLMAEKDRDYRVNPELADHIWGGECRSQSAAQIFKGKYKIANFEPDKSWYGPYFGCDWGFSTDPMALTKSYIDAPNRRLYVRNETGGTGIELDHIPSWFDKIPESRTRKIRADNARPETISFVKRQGFNIVAVEKWKGSVEDGIEFLKNFDEIIIHSECVETAKEMKNYSYKVDRLTNDVTTDIVDAWNHYIDSLRYAFEPMIKKEVSILDVL